MGTVTYNSKTTDSITVQATATDNDGDELEYTLYISETETGGYTANGTATGAAGNTVTLTATGLKEYTTYYYYVEVTDRIAKAETGKGANVKTYCPGTGLTCEGPFTRTCDTCLGVGTISGYCPGGEEGTKCSVCGGLGRQRMWRTILS